MKKIKLFILFAAILCLSINQAKADSIATQEFGVNAGTSILVNTTGNFSGNIDGDTGNLNSILWVNFMITSNYAVNDLRLTAYVEDKDGNQDSAFWCGSSTPASTTNASISLGNTVIKPSQNSINNGKKPGSSCIENPESLAYPVTINITNGGTCSFDSANGYFNITLPQSPSNISDINVTLSQSSKGGTYNLESGCDTADPYQVKIYLENLPT